MIDRWIDTRTHKQLTILLLLSTLVFGMGAFAYLISQSWQVALIWGLGALGVLMAIALVRLCIGIGQCLKGEG